MICIAEAEIKDFMLRVQKPTAFQKAINLPFQVNLPISLAGDYMKLFLNMYTTFKLWYFCRIEEAPKWHPTRKVAEFISTKLTQSDGEISVELKLENPYELKADAFSSASSNSCASGQPTDSQLKQSPHADSRLPRRLHAFERQSKASNRLLITCSSKHTFSEFKSVVVQVLTDLLQPVPNGNLHSVSAESDSSHERVEEIIFSYTSNSAFSLEPCNQVPTIGPPVCSQDVPRSREITEVLAILKTQQDLQPAQLFDHSCEVFVDVITLCKWDIPDIRLVWSTNPSVTDQLRTLDVTSSSPLFSAVSLHPPLWRHDVSFWQNDDHTTDELQLLQAIRETCGRVVSQVILMNVWTEPETGKTSRCYRLIYQTPDEALSQEAARELQLTLRKVLEEDMNISLR